jgi:prophage regulatory protein
MTDIQLIALPDVTKIVGLSGSTIYRYIGYGMFPKPVKIGPLNRWVESEIQAWLEERMAERATG